MEARSPVPDVEHLVVLAEQIEQDSRAGRAVTAQLLEFRDAVVELRSRIGEGTRSGGIRDVERLLRVVDQLSRDVHGGRVQSISGLAGETRRLARQLDGRTPAAA